jgi:rod shape determining protein RodA
VIKKLVHFISNYTDQPLMTLLGILLAASMLIFYSASGQSPAKLGNHIVNITVALVAMWTLARVPPQYLMHAALPAYAAGVLLLIAVATVGDVSRGAQRWLDFGLFRIQPSELMKLAVPLMLAWYFGRHESSLRLKQYVMAIVLLLVPVVFVIKQPDLGTAILIFTSGFFVLYLAGLSWKIIVAVSAVFAASIPLFWSMLHDYQRQRVLTLLDPWQDPTGTGYHIIQSTIALGSGGVLGKGWLNGSQAHLDFLPECTTDFIFAVFAEEFGLLGCLLMLLLFSLIIARGLMIAANASTLFARLLAGSITLTFFIYAFVNMAMVSGLLPVVGIPLPLVSYGGTSMLTILAGFGILMSIQTHRKLVKT